MTRRFEELKARANGLGWELHDKDEHHPWGYVLRPLDQETVDLYTNSAVRLDPEDPDNPLTGMDSVSHMLDQIEYAKEHGIPLRGDRRVIRHHLQQAESDSGPGGEADSGADNST
jgi:hypothetical protein